MPGLITIEYLLSVFGGNGINGMTSNGGTYHTYTNASGGTSVGNLLVVASSTVANGVTANTITTNSNSIIGVSNQSGIANGSPIQVVTEGNAIIQVDSTNPVAFGDYMIISPTTPSKVISNYSVYDSGKIIGISLGTVAQGTSNATVLVKLKRI